MRASCAAVVTMIYSRVRENSMEPSTIFALSSGRLPAAIAVVRVSGPRAGEALMALARRMPAPREAMLREAARSGRCRGDRRRAGAVVSRPAQRDR